MCNFQRTKFTVINLALLRQLPRSATHVYQYAPLLIRRFLVLLASNSKLILRNMVSQN